MKKGFTLVELLGVIIILAVIATVAVISIAQSIQKGKKTACLAEEKSIIEAAKTWQTDNPIITANNIYVLTMLTNSGYLEKDLKNPMTGKAYKVGTHVKITPAEEEAGNYSYDYKLVYGTGDKACDGTDGENSEEIITVDMPTAEYCKPSLVYTGSSQTLVKEDIIGFTWKQGKTRTNAGSQNVRAALDGKYTWTDGTTDVKMINCSIAKATPIITLSSSSDIIEKGKTKTFNATVKSGASNDQVSGNLNVVSGDTSKATVTPTGNVAITNANNSTGVTKTETVTGVAAGDSAITVKFTPTDTNNYNNAANKTYTAKVRNFVPVPTTDDYCNALTYNGSSQSLVKTAATGFTWTSGTTRTNAGTQDVTATLASGYAWSDGSTETKTISCSISKATPVITLSASLGIVKPGSSLTFSEKANVAGKFTNISGSTGIATVSPASYSSVAANTEKTVTLTGGNTEGTSTITVTFIPTDTANYKSITNTSNGGKEFILKNYKVPTFTTVNVKTGKKVTITYPSVCDKSGFTCKYKVGSGDEKTTTSNLPSTTVTASGKTTIKATVHYGDYSISSTYDVTITPITLTARANIGGKVTLQNITKETSVTAQSNSSKTIDAINGDEIKATATPGVSGYYYSLYKLIRGATGFKNSASGLTNMSSGKTFTAGSTNQEVRGIFEITNQTYVVQSGVSNYCLWWYSGNQNVGLYPYKDITNQQWNLVTRGVDDSNNVYYTLALEKNGHLFSIIETSSVTNGTFMVARDSTVAAYKYFYLVPRFNLLQIVHKNSKKCLTYNTATVTNGSNVVLWTCNDNEKAHTWSMTPPSLMS